MKEMSFIVPWKAVDILSHLPTDNSDQFKIIATESSVKFSLDNISLISLLINVSFRNMKA